MFYQLILYYKLFSEMPLDLLSSPSVRVCRVMLLLMFARELVR